MQILMQEIWYGYIIMTLCNVFLLFFSITGNQSGWTALMYATQFNYSNIVQFLVEHQAELDAQNEVCVLY